MRIAASVFCTLLALAYVAAGPARTAADGGSGTYTAAGSTYGFDLLNAGTTGWQYFYLVGPPGMTFVGGATAGEITARCVAGQPDGIANEIECGPLSTTGLQPNVHVAFVATLGTSPVCGAPFQLDVSSTAGASFTRVTDVTLTGSCSATAPKVVTPPVVHGAPRVGRTLTATPPTWSATPTRVVYRWQLCKAGVCRAIRAATARTLKLTVVDKGHTVRVAVTATFDAASLTSVSKRVSVS